MPEQPVGSTQYEVPVPTIFQNKFTPRLANKDQLADAAWDLMPADMFIPPGDVQYALDGGALLHRIIWNCGSTYEICEQYVMYVNRR